MPMVEVVGPKVLAWGSELCDMMAINQAKEHPTHSPQIDEAGKSWLQLQNLQEEAAK